MTMLTTLIQWGILYTMCDFQGSFWVIVFASFLLSSASCSVALVLGALVDDVKTASEVQPLVFTPQRLFAGFFIRTQFIPPFLRWIQYLCSLKYAVSLILIAEFFPTNSNCQGEAQSVACDRVLRRNGLAVDDAPFHVAVLLALFLLFRIVAGLVLVRRANRF